MLKALQADLAIIRERDPAARGTLEILLCYPGLHALMLHRLCHRLWLWRTPVLPRLISQFGRWLTGIEIHPGARIGRGVFIDHGMGVVIGETAVVGDKCLLYQGVTLGGTGKIHGQRHPMLESDVVVGAGAKILGAIKVGANTRIGAGSVVLRDVPRDSTVVGIPGRVINQSSMRIDPLEHSALPDAEAQVIRSLIMRLEQIENELARTRALLQSLGASITPDKSHNSNEQIQKGRDLLSLLGEEEKTQK